MFCASFAKNHHRFRAARGFGLLEVILVFVLVIGASAIVFSIYQSASQRSRISEAIDQMATIVGNLRASPLVQGNVDLTGLTAAQTASLIPANLQTNPWGGTYTLSFVATTSKSFKVKVGNVDPNDCAPFILAVRSTQKSGSQLALGPATIESPSGTIAVPVGPLAPGTRCASVTQIDSIDFNVSL